MTSCKGHTRWREVPIIDENLITQPTWSDINTVLVFLLLSVHGPRCGHSIVHEECVAFLPCETNRNRLTGHHYPSTHPHAMKPRWSSSSGAPIQWSVNKWTFSPAACQKLFAILRKVFCASYLQTEIEKDHPIISTKVPVDDSRTRIELESPVVQFVIGTSSYRPIWFTSTNLSYPKTE